MSFGGLLIDLCRCVTAVSIDAINFLTRRLCEAGRCQRWRGTAEKFGEAPQILSGCYKQDSLPDAAHARQPKPVEPENPGLPPARAALLD